LDSLFIAERFGACAAALPCGATFQGSLFARPFGGFAASVWPFGPPLHIARPAAAPQPAITKPLEDKTNKNPLSKEFSPMANLKALKSSVNYLVF